MMRRLRLPELGSELRPPSTASGAAGAAGGAGQGAPAKRRSPKVRPGPNAIPEVQPEFSMVLRPRREVNYAEFVADEDSKQRPSKVPRIDNPAGARRRAATTVDPDTMLENLDSKYVNDLDARNRAISSVVRTRSLPASCPRFLERRRRRRRTAVRAFAGDDDARS